MLTSKFSTNSCLCHPVDCAEVICFWTIQLLSLRHCLASPLQMASAAAAQPHPSRRRRNPLAAAKQSHPCRRYRQCDFATCVRWRPGWPGPTDPHWLRHVPGWTLNTLAIQNLCAAAYPAQLCCGPERLISRSISYEIYIPGLDVICHVYTCYIYKPNFTVIYQVYTWYIYHQYDIMSYILHVPDI
jgi:hypothetical protein